MFSNLMAADSAAHGTPKPRLSLQLCTLCNCTLNSDRQAQAHFAGVSHLCQLQARGLPLPANVDVEKLQKAAVKSANKQGSSRLRPQWTEVQNCIPYQSYPLQHAASVQHSYLNGMNYIPTPSSRVLSTQKLVFAQLPVPSGNSSTTAHHFNHVPVSGVPGSSIAPHSWPTLMHRKNYVTCEVCQQVLNSESQAAAHFNGVPHQKKCNQLSIYMQSASGPDTPCKRVPSSSLGTVTMCLMCRVTVNSAKQFELHERGRLHQNKLRSLRSVAPPVEKGLMNVMVETSKLHNSSLSHVVCGETGVSELYESSVSGS